MSTTYFMILCFGVLALSLRNVRADAEEDRAQLRASILPILADCSKEFGITGEEISTAKQTQNTNGLNPCFMACFLKRGKIINDEGNFDTEKSTEIIKLIIKDEDNFKKFEEVIATCSAVNEKPVTDEKKGCERAQLLVSCLMESKADFTPFLSL